MKKANYDVGGDKDRFSSPLRSDHQTVNLLQNARTMEQVKKAWYKSSV